MKLPKNIPKVKLDRLSYVSVPIGMYFSETKKLLANGTGFIYQHNEYHYLITNWHNITGINPITKKPLSIHAGRPDLINFPLQGGKKPFIKWKRFSLKLFEDDKMGEPNWLIHPVYKEKVDVAALEVKIPEEIFVYPINKQDFEDIKPEVSDEIFILGFPYNLKGGGNFPIWKRGSIATEPDIDYEGLPKILVDTASRRGMSGAPVIYRRSGIHNFLNGQPKKDSIIGTIQGFVGIYSGRILGETEWEAQLGIVWKAQVIEEIINGNIKDDVKNISHS